MSQIVQANFRMSKDLKDKLEVAAEKNGRSLTSEIVTRLEDSFKPSQDSESNIKIYTFDDMAQAAMSIVISDCVLGLMESNYPDVELEQHKVTGQWVLKYKALRSTVTEDEAQQLVDYGCTLVR